MKALSMGLRKGLVNVSRTHGISGYETLFVLSHHAQESRRHLVESYTLHALPLLNCSEHLTAHERTAGLKR